ncbi:AAA family ATPase [Pararoseomonas indoligenes]|uniref:Rad50/SbcC-type AAA domain-containing protein n=1 Tax=Roseomonas indoligenes TaxID=2820811 RepID=A0A940MYM7_9PROT|nr:AAA family ATPase [Pararoseomonas indoligenes]MBP0495754.1 hypothetical protein [Pararoseomonas indoligenes]
MKTLRFERLELLSLTEKKGRVVEFHPRCTIITGTNGVGKSSIIKSLYWILGASPIVVNPRWIKLNVKGSLVFLVDEKRYRAVRNNSRIAVFAEDGERLISTAAFTKELAPFFAQMLDFGLLMANRNTGAAETPPPAYAFLPYYVDQDGGWNKPLTSFDHLTQYSDFKKKVIEFHTGIRPNRYYELDAEKKQLDIAVKELERDHKVARTILERLKLDVNFTALEFTGAEHEASIEKLLMKMKSLRDLRKSRARELGDILDERVAIDQQFAIVQAAAAELALDAEWAAADERSEIPCPTCGTRHQNDFSNRFSILADREECFEFLSMSKRKIEMLVARTQSCQEAIASTDESIVEIEKLLDTRQGDVTLKEVIQNEGRQIAAKTFDDQIKELEANMGEFYGKIAATKRGLKDLEDKELKKKIQDYYAALMHEYVRQLNISDPDLDAISKITGKVMDTGSEQPRLMLAYVLALADTIQKYTSAFVAPLVIDSPVQQEQDTRNAPAIIQKVVANRPNGGQSIIGTISLHGVVVDDCKVVTLEGKSSALLASEYDEVYRILDPLLAKM